MKKINDEWKYVIYDQFHWLSPDHLERHAEGWENALKQYAFYKAAYSGESLGLVTKETYNKIKPNYEKIR